MRTIDLTSRVSFCRTEKRNVSSYQQRIIDLCTGVSALMLLLPGLQYNATIIILLVLIEMFLVIYLFVEIVE